MTSAEEKKDNAWFLLIAAVTVIVVVLIVLSVKRPTQKPTDYYNDYEFYQDVDGLWYVRILVNNQPTKVVFHYHPSELEDIPIQEGVITFMRNLSSQDHLYVAVNPDEQGAVVMAGVEIAKIAGEKFGILNIPTQASITLPSEKLPKTTPVVSCNNATTGVAVVWIKTQGENLIARPLPWCVVVQGTTADDTVKVADRLVYTLLGVMDA